MSGGGGVLADVELQLQEILKLLNTLSCHERDPRFAAGVGMGGKQEKSIEREREETYLATRPCSIGSYGSRPFDII